MRKFLEKVLDNANEVSSVIIAPPVFTFAIALCANARIFGLSTGWTAYILSGIALLVGLYRWDHLSQVKVRRSLERDKAAVNERARILLEEGRKAIQEEEGRIWWENHIEEVSAWSDQITGCGMISERKEV